MWGDVLREVLVARFLRVVGGTEIGSQRKRCCFKMRGRGRQMWRKFFLVGTNSLAARLLHALLGGRRSLHATGVFKQIHEMARKCRVRANVEIVIPMLGKASSIARCYMTQVGERIMRSKSRHGSPRYPPATYNSLQRYC